MFQDEPGTSDHDYYIGKATTSSQDDFDEMEVPRIDAHGRVMGSGSTVAKAVFMVWKKPNS